jgi:hypothetical protein
MYVDESVLGIGGVCLIVDGGSLAKSDRPARHRDVGRSVARHC